MHICARLRLAGRPPNPALETWPARRTHTTHTTQNTHTHTHTHTHTTYTQMHNTAQHRTHTQHSTTHHSTERNTRRQTTHRTHNTDHTQNTYKTSTHRTHNEHAPHTQRTHTQPSHTSAHTHIYSPGVFGARRRGLPHEIGPTEFKKSASGGQMCSEHTQNGVAIRYSLAG